MSLTLGTRLTLVYTVLAIAIMYTIVCSKISLTKNSLLLFVVSILCIFSLHFSPNISHTNKTIYNHLVWLIFIYCIASSLQPIYNLNSGTFKTAFVTTIILTTLIVVASSFVTTNIQGWKTYLFWTLLSLIIFRLFDTPTVGENKMYGKITVVLFTLFIIYDVQYLNRHATSDVANLPRQSLSLFLDFINMFSGVVANK